jgi:hypothetical protein
MAGLNDAFNSMPVNTRWMMLIMLVVTVGGNFGMLPLNHMFFNPELVLKFQVRHPSPQKRQSMPALTPQRRADLEARDELLLPGPVGFRLPYAHDDTVRVALGKTLCGHSTAVLSAALSPCRPVCPLGSQWSRLHRFL